MIINVSGLIIFSIYARCMHYMVACIHTTPINIARLPNTKFAANSVKPL